MHQERIIVMESFKKNVCGIGEKILTATNEFVVDTDTVKKRIVGPLSSKFNDTIAYANHEMNVTTKKWQSSISQDCQEVGIILRVTGLGHNLTLTDLSSTTTVSVLQKEIHKATGLPPRYQRLIGPRGLKINWNNDDGNGDGNDDDKNEVTSGMITLSELGIENRTKLMLLHSPFYAIEKDVYEQLRGIEQEIDDLESNIQRSYNSSDNNENQNQLQRPIQVSEMVTRICCKLDTVDIKGSKALRLQRKELIKKAEGLETVCE